MNITIRKESKADYDEVEGLIFKAFENLEESDQTEHLLVNRLRREHSFIPELSMVASHNNTILGHILLTPISIRNKKVHYPTLALAPVSVLPEFQNLGIGSALIFEAHDMAKKLGYESIVLIGHEAYYPRFGYAAASSFGIHFPFEAPDQNCFAIALDNNSLKNISGEVVYPSVFFG